MKIAHFSDLHYCPKHLKWVDRAMSAGVDSALEEGCDLAVISGDSFEHPMALHEPAVVAYTRQVLRLASAMPEVVLAGTQSHDHPGVLDYLTEIETRQPILVVSKPMVAALIKMPTDNAHTYQPLYWMVRPENCTWESVPWVDGTQIIVCALPSVNKAEEALDLPATMAWFKEAADKAHAIGVPCLLVTHGTIYGSITESRHAMVSPDHEFTLDMLYSSGADAIMIGHIHAHQYWEQHHGDWKQVIAYPGSLARLVHGDHSKKGWILWDVEPGNASFELIESPTRQLLEIEFAGPPDMEDLEELAQQAGEDDAVRVRWMVDAEHAHSIDKEAVRALFEHCDAVKVEGTILPVQSIRAEGISRAATLHDKLGVWLETTGDEQSFDGLRDRLLMLESMDDEEILRGIQ